jgi:hypothetical protein
MAGCKLVSGKTIPELEKNLNACVKGKPFGTYEVRMMGDKDGSIWVLVTW